MASGAAPAMSQQTFTHSQYTVRRKIFTLFSQQFHFFSPQGATIAFCKQKAFKLKEDIRIYADENMSRELISVKARSILDFSAAYDVVDATNGQKVGMLKRKGMMSTFVQDEWTICNASDVEIGTVKEDSWLLGLIRRHLINLVPQTYNFSAGGGHVGQIKQNFNFFVPKMIVDFSGDRSNQLDRRLCAAAVVLIMAVEGRQN